MHALRISLLLALMFMGCACNSLTKSSPTTQALGTSEDQSEKVGSQIGEYVSGVFEDHQGNLWFSTISNGVAKYDGNELVFIKTMGERVGSIVEDADKNLWFGTHSGVYSYDGTAFTQYSVTDGLCDDRVSSILVDKSEDIWVATWGGVCKFNGKSFESFPIPYPEIELLPYQTTMDWTTEMIEDTQGNIWFGRDGYGACRYDGVAFTHFTKKDGLSSDNVTDILEDDQGNIWFASRITEKDHPDPEERAGSGGLVKYNGKEFIEFPELAGLYNSEVYQIYMDSKGNIWISTTHFGVYRYNGVEFVNFTWEDDDFARPVMGILEDSKGRIWLGCAGGLFRLKGQEIINVTTNGPWN